MKRRAVVAALSLAGACAALPVPASTACRGTLYLTFDTGNMSVAPLVADTLRKYRVQATFFLANERTAREDFSLDASWGPFWKALAADGHAFGSHTFDHVYWLADSGEDAVKVRPQFGAQAGRVLTWKAHTYCDELQRVALRFRELTGRDLDPLWRAPGGKVSPRLLRVGAQCGWRHVGWNAAGFLGDERSSRTHPNALLLRRALAEVRDGDILMAHLGIWSREDPWAPAVLDPLLAGLRDRGFCFATLRDHPRKDGPLP